MVVFFFVEGTQFTKRKVLVTRRICIFKRTRLSLNCISTLSLIYATSEFVFYFIYALDIYFNSFLQPG
ncbi:hypothetical protein Hanom_Chr04g00359611 [Helianthus anomalus]